MHTRVPVLARQLQGACRLRRAPRLFAPRTRGFTLLHLLAVISLVGTLSALAAPIILPAQP